MSSAYLSVNAWREIFARVLNDADLQSKVSPEWLINPATRRPLPVRPKKRTATPTGWHR